MKLPAPLLLAPLVAAGAAGAAVAVANREADPSFAVAQRNPLKVQAEEVERAVLRAPEPAPENKTKARRAKCGSKGVGDLRNPWRCKVTYASGSTFTYEVRIESDGRFRGENDIGDRIIYGCCVTEPQPG
jgi:hypothetical protein